MGISKGKWQEQLKAAEASGMSLAGYAAQHGIKVRSLYDARRSRSKVKAVPGERASAFVRVKLKPKSAVRVTPDVHQIGAVAPFAMQARLGNGVVLSWTHAAPGGQALTSLLHTLAELPCFV